MDSRNKAKLRAVKDELPEQETNTNQENDMGNANKKEETNNNTNQEPRIKLSTKVKTFLSKDFYENQDQPKGIINQAGKVLLKGGISIGLFSLGNYAEEKLEKNAKDDNKWRFNNMKNATCSTVGLVSNLSGVFMCFMTAGETIDLVSANRFYATKTAMDEYCAKVKKANAEKAA